MVITVFIVSWQWLADLRRSPGFLLRTHARNKILLFLFLPGLLLLFQFLQLFKLFKFLKFFGISGSLKLSQAGRLLARGSVVDGAATAATFTRLAQKPLFRPFRFPAVTFELQTAHQAAADPRDLRGVKGQVLFLGHPDGNRFKVP